MSNTNFYEVLGIEADASPEDVRRAYRRKALQTHPDRLPQGATAADKQAAEERFRGVNNAYEILIDPNNRKLYDLYGVWPPPEEFPEYPKPRHSGRANYPSSHRPRPASSPFDDPFFNSPFGDPFFRHRPGAAFTFRDPFELFNSIFADMQRDFDDTPPSFRSPFGDPFPFSHRPNAFFNHFHAPLIPTVSPFFLPSNNFFNSFDPDESRQDRSSMPEGMQTFSFQSSSRGGLVPGSDGQDPHWVSEEKMVRTVNGVTETIHKKRDSNGNEHVNKIYPDGREIYTINGVEQPPSSRNIENAAPRGRLPPIDGAPYIPPEPESRDAGGGFVHRRHTQLK